MSRNRTSKSIIRYALLLFALVGATDASALLITSATLNGNAVTASPAAGPNALAFTAQFHNLQSLQFDVLIESNDDPFSPIALTGLIENLTVLPWSGFNMTLGGGATLTVIGDVTPAALATAFPRGNTADFAFDPLFAVNTSGAVGASTPWLINTHGARLFSISLTPRGAPDAASVPEPASVALMIIAFAAVSLARRHREPGRMRRALIPQAARRKGIVRRSTC